MSSENKLHNTVLNISPGGSPSNSENSLRRAHLGRKFARPVSPVFHPETFIPDPVTNARILTARANPMLKSNQLVKPNARSRGSSNAGVQMFLPTTAANNAARKAAAKAKFNSLVGNNGTKVYEPMAPRRPVALKSRGVISSLFSMGGTRKKRSNKRKTNKRR